MHPSLRSRRKRKAWGGARRNPRSGRAKRPEPAKAADSRIRETLSPTSRACIVFWTINLGFRCASPQALRYHLLRRLRVENLLSRSGREVRQVHGNVMSLDHAVKCFAIDFQQARCGLFISTSMRQHPRHVTAFNFR